MRIRVNDSVREVPASCTLAGLLSELGLLDQKGLAVAVDGLVVPRSVWPAHALVEGCAVLVIRATQGG